MKKDRVAAAIAALAIVIGSAGVYQSSGWRSLLPAAGIAIGAFVMGALAEGSGE